MTDDKTLPAWLRTALAGGHVLVIRRTMHDASEVMEEHMSLLYSLGIMEAVGIKVSNGLNRLEFLSGGRVRYMGSRGIDEKVRGMQVEMIDDPGYWLDQNVRALIQKRPVLS